MKYKGRDLMKPENLGEGPESRMENFPRKKAEKNDAITGRNPGAPKPAAADAIGDGDADDLAEYADEETIRFREAESQREEAERQKRST